MMGKALQNLALFKAGWIACVLLAAIGRPDLAVLAVVVIVGLHLVQVAAPAKEALLLVAAATLGLAWESLMVAAGLIQYPAVSAGSAVAPYWIVAMWVLFATTINHGFRWIKRHWIIAATLGLIGGPMAFFGGGALGAAQFENTSLSLIVIGLGWAMLLPLLCLIADTIIDSPFLEPHARISESSAIRGLLTALGGLGRDV